MTEELGDEYEDENEMATEEAAFEETSDVVEETAGGGVEDMSAREADRETRGAIEEVAGDAEDGMIDCAAD